MYNSPESRTVTRNKDGTDIQVMREIKQCRECKHEKILTENKKVLKKTQKTQETERKKSNPEHKNKTSIPFEGTQTHKSQHKSTSDDAIILDNESTKDKSQNETHITNSNSDLDVNEPEKTDVLSKSDTGVKIVETTNECLAQQNNPQTKNATIVESSDQPSTEKNHNAVQDIDENKHDDGAIIITTSPSDTEKSESKTDSNHNNDYRSSSVKSKKEDSVERNSNRKPKIIELVCLNCGYEKSKQDGFRLPGDSCPECVTSYLTVAKDD